MSQVPSPQPTSYGIDGAWLDPAQLQVDPACVETCDLEQGFDLGRRFDLVISLEVAEHLAESAAERFIATLTRHTPQVLFSAAIPYRGAHHHLNERFLSHWVELFACFDFRPLNATRNVTGRAPGRSSCWPAGGVSA